MHLHIRMRYNKRCYELLLTSLYFTLSFLFIRPFYLGPPSSHFYLRCKATKNFFSVSFRFFLQIVVHSINMHLLSSRNFLENFTYVSAYMCLLSINAMQLLWKLFHFAGFWFRSCFNSLATLNFHQTYGVLLFRIISRADNFTLKWK